MAQFIKPASVALNTAHALYANIHRFYEFGVLDKELVTDTALTISGASVVTDADIGVSRAFVNGATISESASIPQDCTILLVTAGRGTRVTGGAAACDANFLYLNSSGNKIQLRYNYASGGYFTSRYDGASGAQKDLNGNSFANDAAFNTGLATAFHFADTETRKSALNGTLGSATDAVAGGALGSPPISVPFFATNGTVTIGTTANFPVGAIVVFNTLLSDADMQSITADPWQLLIEPAEITVIDTDDILVDGQQNFTATIVNVPSGEVPLTARIGSTAGVGGTLLSGFSAATTGTAGTFVCTMDLASGIATGSTGVVSELTITHGAP